MPGGGGWQAAEAPGGRRFPNAKSQIYFLDPDGMKIGWQTSAGGNERVYLPAQLTVPARYNFMQGYIYRLKLTDIPGREGVQLYPTIEVAPSTPPTDAYLTHNPIPVQFTPEDFDQVVDGGNFVTKVIYLPDPKYQELAIAGVETLVSTRLEPGVDPILEADKRGTILLIVRLGAIDLEMPDTGTAGADRGPRHRGDPAGRPWRHGPAAGLAPAGPDDDFADQQRAPGDPALDRGPGDPGRPGGGHAPGSGSGHAGDASRRPPPPPAEPPPAEAPAPPPAAPPAAAPPGAALSLESPATAR